MKKTIKISEDSIINDEDGYLTEQLDTELHNRDYFYEPEEVRAAYKEVAERYNIANLFEEYLWDHGDYDIYDFNVENDPCIDEKILYDYEIDKMDDIYYEFKEWIATEWIETIEEDAIEYLKENYRSEDELED